MTTTDWLADKYLHLSKEGHEANNASQPPAAAAVLREGRVERAPSVGNESTSTSSLDDSSGRGIGRVQVNVTGARRSPSIG